MPFELRTMVAKSLLACAVVMLVGAGRLLIDGLIYVGLVLTMGAVSVTESVALVRTMRALRR